MPDMSDMPNDKPNDRSSQPVPGAESLPKDPRELLGGYATGTLTDRELQYLMSAALEDQELFEELQDEVVLKQALEAPGVRQRLLAKLEDGESRGAPAGQQDEKPGWFRWQWGAVGLVAAGLAALTLVLLQPPAQNTEVAQLETQAVAQLEAPAEPQDALTAIPNEAQTAVAAPQAPPPQAEIANPEAQPPRVGIRAADATARAREEGDAATAAPGVIGGVAAPQQVAEADEARTAGGDREAAGILQPEPEPVAAAKSVTTPVPAAAPPPVPAPARAKAVAASKASPEANAPANNAAQEAATVADQATRQFRGAPALEGTATSPFVAGAAPPGVQTLVYNGQPVLPALQRRAGPTGFAYQIVGRTLVIVPSENGYLTVTQGPVEGAAADNTQTALATDQQVLSQAPVTIALGAGNQPVTISFARREGAPAVDVEAVSDITGAVALPVGADRRVTVRVPR